LTQGQGVTDIVTGLTSGTGVASLFPLVRHDQDAANEDDMPIRNGGLRQRKTSAGVVLGNPAQAV
jgi:hypothetical protein